MSSLTIRPAALRPGDTVMVVSPAGPVRPERIARGVELLLSWGLQVVLGADVYARHGYLAGTDGQRLAALRAALADPLVRGVVCARGGYGMQRIVDGLDPEAIAADPKLVIGFSDITALHLALWRAARLSSVHGPVLTQLTDAFAADSLASLRDAVMTAEPVVLTRDPGAETGPVVVPGAPAAGTLLGGNLCLLAASLATADFPALDGAILLLEEVDEPPYKIDRMLTQLRRAGVLRGLAGVAVGQFTLCEDGWPRSVAEVLTDRLGDLGVPVLGGLPVGHGEGARSVPVGVPAILDVAAGTLTASPAARTPS